MVDVCPSARGREGLESGAVAGGESSRAVAVNSRQQAEAVEQVTRSIWLNTALICLRVQFAISGRSASMAE